MIDLKELAKTLFFNETTVEKFRNDFLENLKTRNILDKRNEGCYCYDCNRFGKEMAFKQENKIVFPKIYKDEVWIVTTHYDGCRGWD